MIRLAVECSPLLGFHGNPFHLPALLINANIGGERSPSVGAEMFAIARIPRVVALMTNHDISREIPDTLRLPQGYQLEKDRGTPE